MFGRLCTRRYTTTQELQCELNGLVLDIKDAYDKPEVTLHMWPVNQSPAQKWTLEPIGLEKDVVVVDKSVEAAAEQQGAGDKGEAPASPAKGGGLLGMLGFGGRGGGNAADMGLL